MLTAGRVINLRYKHYAYGVREVKTLASPSSLFTPASQATNNGCPIFLLVRARRP